MAKTDQEILKAALDKWGATQVIVAVEELSELQKELCKYLRGKARLSNIAEEMADVEIMLAQLKLKFKNADEVEMWRKFKIDRLEGRLEDGQTTHEP